MTRLTCELCGSIDLVKSGDYFVCQHCGCKYSLEEARRMMTVKVDNSDFIKNSLANARRAKEKEDWEETEKYYNLVEQNDPDNIEAIFGSAYGKARSSLIESDVFKRQQAFKVLKNSLSIIDDHYKTERREENEKAIISISNDLANLMHSNFVFTQYKNGYGMVLRTDMNQTVLMLFSVLEAFKESIDHIKQIDDQLYLHYTAISLYDSAIKVSWGGGMNTVYLKRTALKRWIETENYQIATIKKAENLKKANTYWAEHPKEKVELEAKKASFNHDLAPLNLEFQKLQLQINEKNKELNSLGVFKKKEKVAIQKQIDELQQKLYEIQNKRSNILSQIKNIDRRLSFS